MNPIRDSVTTFVEDHELEYVTPQTVDSLADDIDEDDLGLTPWVWPPHPTPDDVMPAADRLDFYMLGNTINFQFRDPDSPAKYTFAGTDFAGADGMWAALKHAYDEHPDVLDGAYLADLDEDDVASLFPADGDVDMPMIPERTRILNDVGATLEDTYDGRFHHLVDDASPRLYDDGDGIIDRLVDDFPSYDDAHEVDGHEVNLYKRAQLAVWMPLGHLNAIGEADLLQVADPENFELAADYHMPNILEYHGALTDDNREHIDQGRPLVAGSRAEVERRAVAVYQGRQLADALDTNGAELDGVLFTDYKDVAEEAQPVHKTVTVEDGVVRYGTTDY